MPTATTASRFVRATLDALPSLISSLVASLVAPPRCAACDAHVPAQVVFCAPCAATLEPLASSGPAWSCPFAFGGALSVAIRRLKYDGRPDLARPLAHAALRALSRGAPVAGLDVVVPVPLHRSRLVVRGYNQAALLASVIAHAKGLPHAPRAIERRAKTQTQTALGRADRAENLAGAIVARDARRVRGKRVLLVDDVRTTGATLAACTTALCDAGARSVHALVVAATP